MRLIFAVSLLAALLVGGQVASPAPVSPADLVKAELVAEPLAVTSGERFWVAVRLRMKEGWHTYWRNPGDSGRPTEIKWSLPEGFSAGEIAWPTPHRIPVGDLINYGYEREAVLLVPITPSPELDTGRMLALKADVSWLVCEKECVPGSATLALDLRAAGPGTSVGTNPVHGATFAQARARLPVPSPWPASAELSRDALILSVDADAAARVGLRGASFFPYSDSLIDHAAPQRLEVGPDRLTLRVKRAAPATAAASAADGLLVIDGAAGPRGYEISPPLRGVSTEPSKAPSPVPAPAPAADLGAVLGAALLAFAGGVMLNLMPCVFPVLSIKVLALLRPGESAAHMRWHGLAYTLGVLVSFLALAGLLLGLRAGGAQVGWGFQLQSPALVAALAYLLFAMGLSLSGVYHIGSSLAGVGDALARHGGAAGSFFTGVLATVVATPCTAPFMGAAVGFALTQAPAVALAVFAAMGLGMAAPFLALTLVPAWMRRLPRPGAWMETLKQALAFPLYATTAWLVWVLAQEVGATGLLIAMLGLVLVGLAGWCLALAQRADGSQRRVAQGLVLGCLALLGGALSAVALDRRSDAALATVASGGTEPFSQARLDALLREGRPVFVNMTAAWCITCLVNERAVLGSRAVRTAFADKGVAYLKGDWTNQNPEITRVLERHGRSGVPLYLVYGGGDEPVVLPQILTQSGVLASLDGIGRDLDRKRAGQDRVPADAVRHASR